MPSNGGFISQLTFVGLMYLHLVKLKKPKNQTAHNKVAPVFGSGAGVQIDSIDNWLF